LCITNERLRTYIISKGLQIKTLILWHVLSFAVMVIVMFKRPVTYVCAGRLIQMDIYN